MPAAVWKNLQCLQSVDEEIVLAFLHASIFFIGCLIFALERVWRRFFARCALHFAKVDTRTTAKTYERLFVQSSIFLTLNSSRQLPPPKQVRITQARRTRVGSISKYSAIPPHTPHSIQFTVDLYKRLLLIINSSDLTFLSYFLSIT